MLDQHSPPTAPLVTLVQTGPEYTARKLVTALPRSAKSSKPAAPLALMAAASTEPGARDDVRLKFRDEIQRAVEDCRSYDADLWSGDWSKAKDPFSGHPKYPSQSEADYDQARTLARWFSNKGITGDELPVVVEAAFEQSGLAARDKWQNRRDYRERTLASACAGLSQSPTSTNAATRSYGAAKAGNGTVDWAIKADLRSARYFSANNLGKYLYIHDKGSWLRWDAERWRWSEKGEEVEAAKTCAVALTTEAALVAATDPDRGAKLVREAAEAHKEPRIMAMLKLARSEPGMSATTNELDADPMLLGVGNGVVDLQTATLIPNRPGRLISRYCDADFSPGAPALRWTKFLHDVFENDTDTIDAVQKLVGLTLTGISREELLIFAVGNGANGKSIFSNIMARVLADYSVMAPSTLLAARRADDTGPRSDLAMLAGSRLVSINELPGGMTLDETVAKQLAGREPVTARFLHREFFTFQPRFTPWVRTNHRPIIKGTDDGIWRRLRVIRFGRTFGPEDADPRLEEKLWAERNGILNWMVEGAKSYLADGLAMSPAMRAELNYYRTASDVLGEFLADKTDKSLSEEVGQGDLFVAWQMWCEANGHQPGAKATFTERLAERGYGTRKSGAKRFYTGLKLRVRV